MSVLWLLGASGLPGASGQDFQKVYLRGTTQCGAQTPPSGGMWAGLFSDLLTFRLTPLDEGTAADLFGQQLNQSFFVYRLCLSNNGRIPKSAPPAIYLLKDFLQFPVTLSKTSGAPLTADAVELLSRHPQFKNSGFSKIEGYPSAQHKAGPCPFANALFTPASVEQLVEGSDYGLSGLFKFLKPGGESASASQRRNVLAHGIRLLEKISPQQHLERVLMLPKTETVGGQQLKLFLCPNYIRAGIVTAPVN
jgi:hypothetical protein